ncbi:MAG: tRNA lysidine(34) synthetase TilS [Opitutaceae bacterium]
MKRRPQTKPDWPAVAATFSDQIPHAALHPVAMLRAQAECRREMRRGGRRSRWALALSGGADSLALLLMLWAKGPGRWGRDFVVLHFNHRLRGRAADEDEEFCRELCAALKVKFVPGRWREAPKIASEGAARAARQAFFLREMKRRKLRLLWLAHQQDDIAESMLMRLARGSGAGGLAAPRPVQIQSHGRLYLRPMLTLKKATIVAALSKAGAVWREDASNAGRNFFRNRVRHDVLPAWEKAAERDALAGAARSRELLEEDEVALETWLDELRPLTKDGSLNLTKLAGKPRAVVRRAVHRWLRAQPEEIRISRQAFEALLEDVMIRRTTRHSMGPTQFAQITRDRLRLA